MKKILKILNVKKKIEFFTLSFLILLNSILEVLTIGAFFPLVSILIGNKNQKLFNIEKDFEILGFIEKYTTGNSILILSLIIFICIFFFKNLVVIYSNWYREEFNSSLRHKLSTVIFQTHLRKNIDFFHVRNTSDYTNQAIIQSSQAAESINALIFLINEILVFVFILTLFLIVDYKVTLALIFFFLVFTLPYLYISKIKIENWASKRIFFEKNQIKNILECFSMFKLIKVNSLEKNFFEEYKYNNYNANNLLKLILFLSLIPKYFLEIITVVLISAIILLFIISNKDPIDSLPIIAIFLLAASRLVPSLNKISNSASFFISGIPVIKSVSKDINKNNFNLKEEEIKYEDFKKIELKKISFSYKNKIKIIKNFSLTIKKGDKIIIKGPSGVGKSSLLEIILGLRKFDRGDCYLNEKKVNNYKLYKKIKFSYLPQSGYIVDDTIKNNIKLNNQNLSNKFFWKLIDICQLKNFILKQKNKENFLTGENGSRLSGGQKQRICLARALAASPNILILDESSNAVDTHTENLILRNLIKDFNYITLIMVTHRKTNAKYFNKVIDMTSKKIKVTNRIHKINE